MVILKRIYSQPKLLFDEVRFLSGINIIKGIYSDSSIKSDREINGVGKSTLIRLIDFALLSKEGQKVYFSTEKLEFLSGFSVILEFSLSKKTYCIKRSFDNPETPEFGEDITSLDKFDVADLRRILGSHFFGRQQYTGVYENIWFRRLLKFFIKDDLVHHERKDPLKFSNIHSTKFIDYKYNLFLMGIPNKAVNTYSEASDTKRGLEASKREVISTVEADGKKIEKLYSDIQFINQKIKTLEKSLGDYSFSKSYDDIEKELVTLSSQISSGLRDLNIVERKLREYQESYEINIEIDEQRIIQLYNSIKRSFGSVVKKELTDVIRFRKDLAKSRKNFIQQREKELGESINSIKNEISLFEKERTKLYQQLDEKEAFDSIKNAYSRLIEEKAKKEKLLSYTSQIEKLENEISKKKESISTNIIEIAKEIKLAEDKIAELSALFFEIVHQVIHLGKAEDAIFAIYPSSKSTSPLKITCEIPKIKSLGKSRLRILVYDLTLFFNIITNNLEYPHFLIHDGVFHAIDPKTIIRTLNFVYSKSLQHPNFQYIVTMNQEKLFKGKEEEFGNYNFNIESRVIATYTDKPEEMIFKREYD